MTDDIFDLLTRNQEPDDKAKPMSEDKALTHFIVQYKTFASRSTLEELYAFGVYPTTKQTIYTLRAQKHKCLEAPSVKEATAYQKTFNSTFTDLYQLARNVYNNRGVFGTSALYRSGSQYLNDMACYIETHCQSEDELIQTAYGKDSFQQNVQLVYLKQSPRAFFNSEKNPYLRECLQPTNQITHRLAMIKSTMREGQVAVIQQLGNQIAGLNEKVNTQQLATSINNLENSIIRIMFGWMTGGNQRLKYLKQLQITAPIINKQLKRLEKDIQKQHGIELAKTELITLTNKITQHAERLSEKEISDYRQQIDVLQNSQDPFNLLHINDQLGTIRASISEHLHACMKKQSTEKTKEICDRLTHQLQVFKIVDKDKTEAIISKHRKEIEEELSAIIAESQDAEGLAQLINAIIPTCVKGVFDDKTIEKYETQKEKIASWCTLKQLMQTKDQKVLTTDQVETSYLATLNILQAAPSAAMQKDMDAFLANYLVNIREDLTNLYLSAGANQDADMQKYLEILADRLKMFDLEKLSPIANKNSHALLAIRKKVLDHIDLLLSHADSAEKLHHFVLILEKIWPNGVVSRYVRIANHSNAALTIGSQVALKEHDAALTYDRNQVANYTLALVDGANSSNSKDAIGITLKPNEERVFHFIPRTQDQVLLELIQKKKESFLNRPDLKEAKKKLAFLKNNQGHSIYEVWKSWCNNDQTPLTMGNLLKYGNELIEQYFNSFYFDIMSLHLEDKGIEATWLPEELTREVEAITIAFNQKLNTIIQQAERYKTCTSLHTGVEAIDFGHLLLQWRFINMYRERMASDDNHVGADIIAKMNYLVADHPEFMNLFLQSMTKEQLEVLESTFKKNDAVNKEDGEKTPIFNDVSQSANYGRTILQKSLLLAEMSELIKQELVDYLNNKPINIQLFNEHIAFVLSRLKQQRFEAQELNDSVFLKKTNEELQSALTCLHGHATKALQDYANEFLFTSNSKKSNELLSEVEIIQLQHRTFRQLKPTLTAHKEALLKHLEAEARKPYDHVKDEKRTEAEKMATRQEHERRKEEADKLYHYIVKLGDLDYIHDQECDDLSLVILARNLSPELLQLIHKTHAEKQQTSLYELLNKFRQLDLVKRSQETLSTSKDILKFIEECPQDIIAAMPPEFAEFLVQLKFRFANRFKNSLETMLGERNLTSDTDYQKLSKLKNTEFFNLVSSILNHEHDVCRIFGIQKPQQSIPKTSWGSWIPSAYGCYQFSKKAVCAPFQLFYWTASCTASFTGQLLFKKKNNTTTSITQNELTSTPINDTNSKKEPVSTNSSQMDLGKTH